MRQLLECRRQDVDTLHKGIIADLQRISHPWEHRLTLFDTLLLGSRLIDFSPEEYATYRKMVLAALEAGSPKLPKVSHLGRFNLMDISSLGAAYRFLLQHYNTPYWEDVLINDAPKPHKLIEISGHLLSPTGVLSLKYFWLYMGYEHHSYDGVLPHTRPVVEACKFLWRTDFGTPLGATMHQHRVAVEPFDAMYVNSCLWLIGRALFPMGAY